MRTLSRLSFLAGLLWLLAIVLPGPPLLALTNNGGGGAANFRCDVNSRQCTCSGTWEGADCQAMARNCDLTGSVRHWCHLGTPPTCACNMLRTTPTRPLRPVAPIGRAPAVANP